MEEFTIEDLYELSRKIKLNEEESNILANGNKILKSINDIDFTSDTATQGIYYALSSFFSLTLILSRASIFHRILSRATYVHMNTKVLPKYRIRLMNIYKSKADTITERIETLKNKLDEDDKHKADIEQEIEELEVARDEFMSSYSRLKMVK